MVDIKIDEKIKKILPDFVLGYIKGEVNKNLLMKVLYQI